MSKSSLVALGAMALIVLAGPALAQSIDLSPVQTLLQSLHPRLEGLPARLAATTDGQLSAAALAQAVNAWGTERGYGEQLLQLLILDESLAQLAISAALLRQAGEGVQLASHAIAAEPNSGNAWIAYGISLAQTNDLARAAAAFCTTLRVVGWTQATRQTVELIAQDGQGYGDGPRKAATRTLSECASPVEAR